MNGTNGIFLNKDLKNRRILKKGENVDVFSIRIK
jgi:hypothetical protein